MSEEEREVSAETAEEVTTETETAVQSESAASETSGRRRRSDTSTGRRIISIDGHLQVETASSQKQNDLIELTASMRSRTPIHGRVTGIEPMNTKDGKTAVAVLQKGTFKIMIPCKDFMTIKESDYTNVAIADRSQFESYLMTKRLNSEVDYIVRAIDAEHELVVASRLDAMSRLKDANYFRKMRNSDTYRIYQDAIVEARVCATFRTGIIVEVGGVETIIKSPDLSYQRIQDATQVFSVGDRTVVKILAIEKGEDKEVILHASVKDAFPDPRQKAIKRISEQCRYIGTVTHISPSGIFVSLDSGIDVLCAFPERERPVRGATVSVRITKINEELLRVFGIIVHIV